VSPRSPVAIGDDVVVRLRSFAGVGGQAVLIKELVGRKTATLELRQFNADLSFSVDASEVEAVHKIVGELI
jgi:phage repressor protein C with HTH and peptisase S24 domain